MYAAVALQCPNAAVASSEKGAVASSINSNQVNRVTAVSSASTPGTVPERTTFCASGYPGEALRRPYKRLKGV